MTTQSVALIVNRTAPRAASEVVVEPIEDVAHAHTGPVEKHAHIAFAHAEKSANLPVIKDAAALDMSFWRQLVPKLGHLAPSTATLKSVCKPVTTAGIVEEDDATLTLGVGAGLVDENGVDPARQRTSSLEEIDPAEHRNPCFPDEFFGHKTSSDDAGRKTDRRSIMQPKQFLKSHPIAFDQPRQQDRVIKLTISHSPSSRCWRDTNRAIVL